MSAYPYQDRFPVNRTLPDKGRPREEVLAEMRGRQRHGLSALAEGLLGETERIVATYAARLRTDPGTPSAHGLADAELEDHAVSFVVDLTQCIAVAAEDGPAAARMLRDGSAIQDLISRRHSEQRRSLGWSEPELRREYEILREELLAAVARQTARGGDGDADRAIGIVNHLLDAAETSAAAGFRGQARS